MNLVSALILAGESACMDAIIGGTVALALLSDKTPLEVLTDAWQTCPITDEGWPAQRARLLGEA
jgi:hypothetical protein